MMSFKCHKCSHEFDAMVLEKQSIINDGKTAHNEFVYDPDCPKCGFDNNKFINEEFNKEDE